MARLPASSEGLTVALIALGRESTADSSEDHDAQSEVRIDAAYAEHLFVDSGGHAWLHALLPVYQGDRTSVR